MSTVDNRLDMERPAKMPEPSLRGDIIDADRYISKDYYEKEWRRVWMRTWQIGGLSYHMPEPGDYLNTTLGRESILLVRQENGSVRAFFNVCQHRGARLTFADEGCATDGFTCPYHGWNWGADGLLKAMPDADDFPGGSQVGKLGLIDMPCEEFAGFVWFNMDPNAIPLREALGSSGDEIEGYRMENMVRVLALTADANCNWKVITDNFNEGYHVQVLHPELAPYIETVFSECQFDLRENGTNSGWFPSHRPTASYKGDEPPADVAAMMEKWELNPADYHGNARMKQIRLDIQQQKRRIGPSKGYHHYAHLKDYQLTDYVIYNIFPNNVITVGPDGVQLLRPRPHATDPQKCEFDHWYFVPKIDGVTTVPSPAGGPDLPFEDAPVDHFRYGEKTLGRTNDQDLSIAENQQLGFNSAGYRGANLTNQERRVQHFHDTLNDYIEGRK